MDKNSIEQLRRMELHFSNKDKKYHYDRFGHDDNYFRKHYYKYNYELKYCNKTYLYKNIKSIFDFKLCTDKVHYKFPVSMVKRTYRWRKPYKQYIKLCSKYLYELAQKEGYNYKRDLIRTHNFVFIELYFTFTKLPTSQTILNRLVE